MWKHGRRAVNIEMGPFLEPIRLFLVGGTFPERVLLHVEVSSLSGELTMRLNMPESTNQNGFWVHHFMSPGLTFMLATGSRIPSGQFALAPNPQRFIGTYPKRDIEHLGNMAQRVRNATRRGWIHA